jgi:alpha-amylase
VPEVPKWFWSQFQQAAGVYTVGEVFDYDMTYLAGYLGSMDAVLNYPFFRRLRETVFYMKDMTYLRNYYDEWAQRIAPSKLNYLCNFVDNHDNERVLSWGGNWEDKIKHYKVINAMTLTSVGIPIIYYGTEQYFSGGNDPQNR